jgi:N-hydroxyarylamine O-acetyltransferase
VKTLSPLIRDRAAPGGDRRDTAPKVPGVFDFDAYLARIGLSGRPSLAEVHRAHITSIPFENLDPQRGVPASLALEDLERKLVRERRGGYCFEQNLLLKAGLEALGAEVEMVLARVRVGAEPGAIRPRSHLLLRVRADGLDLHADVGFGNGSLLEPLPWGPGEEQLQAGWRFRIVAEGPQLVLQTVRAGQWVDVYAFLPQASPLVDLETSNWFTSTHPHSPFVTGLIVSTQSGDGARTTLSDWSGLALTEETPEGATVTAVEREAVPGLLAARFGLGGWVIGEGGRLVAGPAAPDARSGSA